MTPRGNPKPPQRPANETVTEIAVELRELASRAQSLLAKLADSGLMTAEEVTEQKTALHLVMRKSAAPHCAGRRSAPEAIAAATIQAAA